MKISAWLESLVNAMLIVVLVGALALPESPARRLVGGWISGWHDARTIHQWWHELIDTMSRIDANIDSKPAIVVCGDYECIFCRNMHQYLVAVAAGDPPVAVAYRHIVLRPGSPAEGAALAAICAEFQDRFRGMNALLYETEEWRGQGDWLTLATQAGVEDVEEFGRCHGSELARERLSRDAHLAEVLEVRATPTIFYAGGRHVGSVDIEQLHEFAEKSARSLR